MPLNKLSKYMECDKASLEIKLLKSIYPISTLQLNEKTEETFDHGISYDLPTKDHSRKFTFIDSDDLDSFKSIK